VEVALMETAGPPDRLYVRARTRQGKVGAATKFYQAIGAVPDTLKTFAFGTLLLFYYNQVLGMDAVTASVAMSAALIIDAVIDPLIGSWSDSLNSRLGRRHPFMYASAVPVGVALYLTFAPPAHLSQGALAVWLFVTVMATNISMSIFLVPWTALYAELSEDYSERTSIVAWRFALGWFSGLVFVFLTWTFIFPSSPAFTPGQLNPHGYKAFALVLAATAFVSILLTSQLTLRETSFLLQPVGKTPRPSLRRLYRELRSALSNRDFAVLFLSALLSSGILGTLATLGIYMQTYFWGLTPEQLRWFSFAILGAVAAFVLVGPIERRLDKKQVLLISFTLILMDGFAMIGMRLLGLLPANGDPRLIAVLVVNEVGQIFLGTVVSMMFLSMLADTLDIQELRTGQRQEGVFSVALTFSGKATAGVGAIIAGFLLEHVLHWPTGIAPRNLNSDLIDHLGVVGGMAAPALLIAPLLLLTRYGVTRQVQANTRRELNRRREAMSDLPFSRGEGGVKSPDRTNSC
jgi:GPH family glycoside/pentoside/hexuronide:cation symporter